MAVPAVQVFSTSHIGLADTEAAGRSAALVHEQAAVAAIAARSRGAATRLIGASRRDDFQALIVGRDGGLRRGRDLRDRRIGLPSSRLQSGGPRVHALRAAIAALESEGLFFRHVQWVDLPPADAVCLTLPGAYSAEIAALQADTVDAVYVRGPAGAEAARAAGVRVLTDIGAHRDPWLRTHTALLQAFTISETLYREHPEFVPELAGRRNWDQTAVAELDALKSFMVRWAFIDVDFRVESWTQRPAH